MFDKSVAPIELKLGEEIVTFSPLTFKDVQHLDNIIRGRVIDAARQSITEETTAQQTKETLNAAFTTASKLSFLSKDMGGGFLETLRES